MSVNCMCRLHFIHSSIINVVFFSLNELCTKCSPAWVKKNVETYDRSTEHLLVVVLTLHLIIQHTIKFHIWLERIFRGVNPPLNLINIRKIIFFANTYRNAF